MMVHNPPWTWTEPVEVRAGLETLIILVILTNRLDLGGRTGRERDDRAMEKDSLRFRE